MPAPAPSPAPDPLDAADHMTWHDGDQAMLGYECAMPWLLAAAPVAEP